MLSVFPARWRLGDDDEEKTENVREKLETENLKDIINSDEIASMSDCKEISTVKFPKWRKWEIGEKCKILILIHVRGELERKSWRISNFIVFCFLSCDIYENATFSSSNNFSNFTLDTLFYGFWTLMWRRSQQRAKHQRNYNFLPLLKQKNFCDTFHTATIFYFFTTFGYIFIFPNALRKLTAMMMLRSRIHELTLIITRSFFLTFAIKAECWSERLI